jgi:hypothetical protein
MRVPVGMGIVAPAAKIKETLDLEPLKQMREVAKAMREKARAPTAASPDSALPIAENASPAPPADDV